MHYVCAKTLSKKKYFHISFPTATNSYSIILTQSENLFERIHTWRQNSLICARIESEFRKKHSDLCKCQKIRHINRVSEFHIKFAFHIDVRLIESISPEWENNRNRQSVNSKKKVPLTDEYLIKITFAF